MGKATILENLGEGYYKIRVSFDNRLIEAQKNAINEKLSKIDAEITTLTNTRQYWEDDFNYRKNWLMNFMETHTNEEYLLWMKEIELAQTHLMESRLWLDKAKKDESLARLNKIKYQKELAYLTKYCPDSIEAYAWCVAYNEDLTGEVATIEIDYHIKRDLSTQQILNHSIAGAMGSQTYMDKTGFWLFDGAGTIDSVLQHPMASSAHAVWFSVCMLPAAQKWKARYRVAIIEAIDYGANKCDLGIFGGFNVDKFQQNLLDKEPIVPEFSLYHTQQNRYRDVTIIYMGSGAETFLVGDLVIVDCNSGSGDPTVIGYYQNPRLVLSPWPSVHVYCVFDYADYVPSGYAHNVASIETGDSTPPPPYADYSCDWGGTTGFTDYFEEDLAASTLLFKIDHVTVPAGYEIVGSLPANMHSIPFPGGPNSRFSGGTATSISVVSGSCINEELTFRVATSTYHDGSYDCHGAPLGDGAYTSTGYTDTQANVVPTLTFVVREIASGETRTFICKSNPSNLNYAFN